MLGLRRYEETYGKSIRPRPALDLRRIHLTPSSIAELYYALGNVANKQASFLGRAHRYQSVERYDNALRHFQSANTDDDQSPAGIAKTHYKLAIQSIHLKDYKNATYDFDPDKFKKMLTCLLVNTLMKQGSSTPAIRPTNPTSFDCISNGAEYRP